jgi:hypothetical protein
MTTAAGPRVVRTRDVLPPEAFAPVDDRTVLTRASEWAAWGLNDGLLAAHAWPYVFEPAQLFPDSNHQPGHFRIGVLPETLLGFCYLTIAQAVAHEPLARCPECQLFFVVDDGRQKFCTPTCANRARFQRWLAQPRNKAKTHRTAPTRKGKAR